MPGWVGPTGAAWMPRQADTHTGAGAYATAKLTGKLRSSVLSSSTHTGDGAYAPAKLTGKLRSSVLSWVGVLIC